ncbi:unnamed protein product [Rotaria sp. Silwood2]|nr:unnamed protein product [Rotaria sp. Silwood2]
MESFYRLPFTVVQCPNLKLKKPSWIRKPSNTTVLFGLLVSYFLVTAGVIYDIIVEPPSVGSTTDEYGHHKPVAFMAWRINGQYIMEGLAASFMFILGGLGFILLDQTNKPNMPRLNRILMIICSFVFILVAYCATKIFIRIKMPNDNRLISSKSTNNSKEDLSSSSSSPSNDITIVNDTVPNWIQSGGQDLRATPDMKTEKQDAVPTTSSSTTTTTAASRIVSTGAIVPEETNQYDDIENRTKIMMRFMDDLTNIYFSTRNSLRLTVDNDGSWTGDSGLGTFRDSLAAVTKYSRCKPIATVNFVGENFAQASIVSSIEFDRDYEHFAVAGVSKKIKLYEYQSVLDNSVELHYPTKEVACTAKLSCISWNPYLRNYLASSDYDGFVTIWDMATAQKVRTFQEHEKRSWSVDFCSSDPKLLASCSDDCRVKIWSMHNDYSVTTIDAKSNVCCVKFKPDSQYNIVFGTADHNLYYFDLRNTREPCNLLKGHKKAVSYARFLSNNEIVSASTDSQLRLWRVTEGQCLRTYRGHVNEKNFVGLAVSSGYIVCGSETNTVHLYQREISRPLLSYKFDDQNNGTVKTVTNTTDRVKKDEGGSEFVSAMCWSNRENILLAANSQGVVKVLELV